MKIWRADEETMALADFNELARDLLHQIVPSAEVDGNIDVGNRLYPSPTGGRDRSFDDEWDELVASDLMEKFQAAGDLVEKDLEQLSDEATAELRIPIKHLDSWINALNQARLAIAARHHFTEKEMDSVPPEGSPHALPLFQMHFYGLLQERFIWELTN